MTDFGALMKNLPRTRSNSPSLTFAGSPTLSLVLMMAACALGPPSAGASITTSQPSVESVVTTVLYLSRTVEIESTLADPSDLWVTPDDLTRVNDFVLKPEGACLDDLCVPVNQEFDSDLVVTRGAIKWFSLTGFAALMGQEFVVDRDTDTWSFGSIPITRSSYIQQAVAPDFTLPDRDGNPISLKDFRGRKVMILSWASW